MLISRSRSVSEYMLAGNIHDWFAVFIGAFFKLAKCIFVCGLTKYKSYSSLAIVAIPLKQRWHRSSLTSLLWLKACSFLAINDEDMPAAQIINTFFHFTSSSMKRFHFGVSIPFFYPPSCYKILENDSLPADSYR